MEVHYPAKELSRRVHLNTHKISFQQGLVVMVNVAVAVDTVQVSHVARLSCHRLKWEKH